jgi:hypothetical protein
LVQHTRTWLRVQIDLRVVKHLLLLLVLGLQVAVLGVARD